MRGLDAIDGSRIIDVKEAAGLLAGNGGAYVADGANLDVAFIVSGIDRMHSSSSFNAPRRNVLHVEVYARISGRNSESEVGIPSRRAAIRGVL